MTEPETDALMEALGRQARDDIEALDGLDMKAADDPWKAALFEPLEDDFTSSIVRKLQNESGTEAAIVDAVRDPDPTPDRDSAHERIHIFPPAASIRAASRAVAATLLMAVAIFVVMRQEAPLPGYMLDLQGTQVSRSSAPAEGSSKSPRAAVMVKRGESLRFRLQPETPVKGELQIAVFVRSSQGAVHPWPEAEARATRRGDGTIWVEDLQWTRDAGEWTLMIRVLRPGEDLAPPGESRAEPPLWIEQRVDVIH